MQRRCTAARSPPPASIRVSCPTAMAAPAPAPAPPHAGKPLLRSIVSGPIARAVWMLAGPTMLQNVIGGLQGLVDHAMVGRFVGYAGNAAIGVAIQIFIVVIVFVMSVFSGMAVLVARFAGANEPEKVNRTVYQAFLAALALWGGVLAPVGWVLAPSLLGLVNAAPAVRVEALPFLRIMFVGSVGMLLFFMVGGALRSAGDARTPLRLGVMLTVLNIVLNVILIRGMGPSPRMRITLSTMLRTVSITPRRSGVRASPAERSAPPTMKNSSMPTLPTNMMRRNGRASTRTAGAAFTKRRSDGASTHPTGASTPPHNASAATNAW